MPLATIRSPHTAPHTGARLPHASVAHLDVLYLGLETAGVPFFYEADRGSPHRQSPRKGVFTSLPAYQAV